MRVSYRWTNRALFRAVTSLRVFSIIGLLAIVSGVRYEAQAAITFVQTKNGGNTNGSVTATFSPAPTSGNLLVGIFASRASGNVTVPGGWQVALMQDLSTGASAPDQVIFYKIAGASEPASVTVLTDATGTGNGLQIYEYSGVDPVTPLAGTGSSTGSLSSGNMTVSSGTVTATTAPALMVAGLVSTQGTSFSAFSNSFTSRNNFTGGSGGGVTIFGGAEFISNVINSPNNYSTSATTNDNSGAWRGQIAAFRAAAPTAADGTISGRITTSDGTPVAGAVVRLDGTHSRRSITNGNGYYRFDNVETNGFYVITPTRANYSFSPANRSFSQLGNRTEATFSANSTGDAASPVDTAEYFVRQLYLDLLEREPDEAGFNYWSDQINQCGSDDSCVGARRRAVAAAFFVESEFQQTGYFVYRLYRGAFGGRPTFAQYLPDRNSVIGGANLDASRITLANDFVQRDAFKQAYPDSLTNDQFVNKLYDTAGLFPYAVERHQEIDKLINGEPRSQVLQDLVEDARFKSAEYNSAFVLTEYFAYLRRDPDETGYDFWLDVVNNREVGNYRAMVCAFITSKEYQTRFSSVITRNNGECGR